MSSSPPTELRSAPFAPTGIEGLGDSLGGGLAANHRYRSGDTVLHVSLSETAQEISSIAGSHGAQPLYELRGVLTGLPVHEDADEPPLLRTTE